MILCTLEVNVGTIITNLALAGLRSRPFELQDGSACDRHDKEKIHYGESFPYRAFATHGVHFCKVLTIQYNQRSGNSILLS